MSDTEYVLETMTQCVSNLMSQLISAYGLPKSLSSVMPLTLNDIDLLLQLRE